VTVRLSLIAAVARNGVIGAAGAMPWRLRTDMLRFKRLTMGKPVVMGRKTYETLGKPLAGRTNIVVSRRNGAVAEGVVLAPTIDAALDKAVDIAGPGGEVMVIGGGEIYAATVGRADRLYITRVDAEPAGDTHFPPIDPALWVRASEETVPAGESDSAATVFTIYERLVRDGSAAESSR
jgi:dihydrofolate reductase